jgi:murein DD-endopeptidase MepM/ murein hydrolase activator NlpD
MLAAVTLTPLSARASRREADVRARMGALQRTMNSLASKLGEADSALAFARARIAQHERELRQANAELAPLRLALGKRAAQMYVLGSDGIVESALAATDLASFLDRTTYLEQVSSGERALMERLTAVSRRARYENKVLAAALADAERARRALVDRRRKLDGMLNDYQSMLNLLNLNSRVVVFRASRGYSGAAIVCPVAGPHALLNNFGDPRPGGPHTGEDISSPYGTPIVAVANGVVTQIVYGGWMGLGIILRDVAGNEWWYAHISSHSVDAGARVVQGQQIGRVGCSGNCTGPHLHFEYHPGGGGPANPHRFLSRVC